MEKPRKRSGLANRGPMLASDLCVRRGAFQGLHTPYVIEY